MIKPCIARIALVIQLVGWFPLAAFLCLVCVANVELDAGAVLFIIAAKRLL